MFLSCKIMRTLFLLSLFPMHRNLADSSRLPENQEDTLASLAGIALPDDDALRGIPHINQFEDSSWIADKNSDSVPLPRLLQQSWIDDNSESLPDVGSASVNCNYDTESSSSQPLTSRGQRLAKRQSKEFCPSKPNAPTTTEQQEEDGNNESPPSSPNYPKIPDIVIPARVDPRRTRTTRKSNSLNDQNALMLLYLNPGFDGRSNTAVCNRDRDHEVPICAPFLSARLSPADIVKPCRFWQTNYFCEFLVEDLWCCKYARQPDFRALNSISLGISRSNSRYPATGVQCILMRERNSSN